MGKLDYPTNIITVKGGIVLNNKDEFCENIRLCESAMYHLAFSIMKNDADAGDVISESIYRAYKNLHTLKNKKHFKTWILAIVHNTAIETIRKNSKMIPTDEIEDSISNDSYNSLTTKLTVHDAIQKLKQPYQTVVILFYLENLSILEISQITHSNIVAVKKQLSRARKMLLEDLKEDFNHEEIR